MLAKLNHLTIKSKLRLGAWFVLVFGLVVMLSLAGLPSRLANQPRFVQARLAVGKQVGRVVAPLALLDRWYQAQVDQQHLLQAYLESQAQLVRLDQLEQENQALRELLDLPQKSKTEILTEPIYTRAQALVAVGSSEGVKSGSLVFANQIFLGVIDQVGPHTASVKLLAQDQDLRLLAKTTSGVHGLVRSRRGQLHLTEVPANLVVKEHEAVFTAGQPGIPAGLLIGYVSQVQPVSAQPTLTINLDQGTSFYEARVIRIVQ